MRVGNVAIVGAGVGGLALALRLAHKGHRVTVFEKTDQVGGRNRSETVGGCRFDGGPTLLMMLDPFRKLFADVGESFEARIPIMLCDPSYRVFYRDGTKLDATVNLESMKARFRAIGADSDADRYEPFLRSLKDLYDESIPSFVRKNYKGLADFATPSQLGRVVRHGMLGNLAKRVEATFTDPRVRMLFMFQTMYLGLSPFDAPWVYATLAYMEYGEGIYYPQGGMPAISQSIANLAVEKGAVIKLNAPVKRVEGKSVLLESGEAQEFDVVVLNADMPYAQRSLEGKPNKRKLRYSCSAYVLYLDYEGEIPGLEHHNVFFGKDFKGNLDSLFHKLQTPEDPAFYVCVSKKSDRGAAQIGRSNVYILIPCPNLDHPFGEKEGEALRCRAFSRLEEEVGFDRDLIRGMKSRTPHDWQNELNLERGAAFGISHDLFQSAFMRPQNVSPNQDGVFYVGASTVPGNGLPMVLISAELAEQRLADWGLA